MFGIGIFEICVILLVTLFVAGPERIPEIARYVANTVVKVRNFFNELKSEVDLKGFLDEETLEIKEQMQEITNQVSDEMQEISEEFVEIAGDKFSRPDRLDGFNNDNKINNSDSNKDKND